MHSTTAAQNLDITNIDLKHTHVNDPPMRNFYFMLMGVDVSCRIWYSVVIYSYVSFS